VKTKATLLAGHSRNPRRLNVVARRLSPTPAQFGTGDPA
jgi:hypothetical protein